MQRLQRFQPLARMLHWRIMRRRAALLDAPHLRPV